jgi:hypothetical protein
MINIKEILFYLHLKKRNTPVKNAPNAWGHQVYNHYFRTIKKDHQLDLNNHTCRSGFIERFANTYVNCARLKNRINKFKHV